MTARLCQRSISVCQELEPISHLLSTSKPPNVLLLNCFWNFFQDLFPLCVAGSTLISVASSAGSTMVPVGKSRDRDRGRGKCQAAEVALLLLPPHVETREHGDGHCISKVTNPACGRKAERRL